MKFGENSFLMLQFKEGYRREQQRKEKESSSARKRREVSASQEQFSIRFRTRHDGMLFLATDSAVTSVSGYTVLEVGLHLHVVLSFERNDAFVLCLLWLICGGRGGNVNGGGGVVKTSRFPYRTASSLFPASSCHIVSLPSCLRLLRSPALLFNSRLSKVVICFLAFTFTEESKHVF